MTAPSWQQLQDYLTRRIPAVLPLALMPGASLVVGDDASWLALRLPSTRDASLPLSPYKEITLEKREVSAQHVLEVRTHSAALYESFYGFAVTVFELVRSGTTA